MATAQITGRQIKDGTVAASAISNDSGVTGSRVDDALDTLNSAQTSHAGNTSNPHSVTAAQVGAIATSAKGAANGVAELDSNGKVPANQMPAIALGDAEVVANDAARFALTTTEVQNGDLVKQSDNGYLYSVIDDTQLDSSAGYLLLTSPSAAPVDSVFGRTGAVVAVSGDYDSDEVTNASTVNGGSGSVSDALEDLQSQIDALPPTYIDRTVTGTVNGSNTGFVCSAAPVANSLLVFLNGLAQLPGTDYTLSSATITFTTAPQTGDQIMVMGVAA